MNVFGIVSSILLAVMLIWAIYHARIIFAGIRHEKQTKLSHSSIDEQNLPKFSLIVPAKDEAAVIHRCLNALTKLNYPKDKMEILVVAGTSKDDTQNICLDFSNHYPDSVKLLCETASKGKPAALNLAFAQATGEIIGVFDADSVPQPDVLQRLASYFSDPTVSAVQGSSVSLNESQNMLTRVAAAEDKAWFQGLLHGREKLGLFVAFTGSCQFIRRSVLEEMDGWEESALAEDVELSLKLVKHGRCVKFAPEVSSGQETPFSLRGLITQRTRWYRGYMEASLKYGSLLDNINRRVIDAELSLIGPFIMIVCFASYINWALSMFFPSEGVIFPFSTNLVILLTSVTLISLGASMAFFEKPVKLKNIIWVPFVYGYWFMQMFIALWAFIQFIFRRRKVWQKTVKGGFVKTDHPSNVSLLKSSPLRVCLVSSYPPNRARLSEYAKNLVNAIKAKSSIGRIYLLADKTNLDEVSEDDPKVEVLRVWQPDNPFSILGIILQIVKLKPDVVHFNIHFQSYGKSRLANFAGFSLTFLSRLLGFKVLVEVHNLGEKVKLEHVNIKPSFLNKVGILVATKSALTAQRVVVTVKSYADYLKDHYGKTNIQYIPHGTVSTNCSFVDPPDKVILFFGHMGPYKGLPIMLQAFEALQKKRANVKLVVAGTNHPNYPNYMYPYVNGHPQHVEFLGYVPEPNLERVFTQSDVVAIPYLAATGTSGVFHLACGYGRPIVASNLPEIRELVDAGASALLVPSGDVEALETALLKVLFDEQLATQMSAQNLAFAHGESWGVIADAYERAYLELAAS
ncbi:MAG: glycosyltransferase [Candidatus Bathyarchaeia archaeon]|jgi:cellulose synthase/poly-beta-1,6-N-acetylglucosamine synthase-like glycosyltransferase/glycosyltransferase involved in cell wall biosynthesis